MKVAIIGGTGKLGLGIAARLQRTIHSTAIGSRELSKAKEAAATLEGVAGMPNGEAAVWCEVAVITVPYAAHRAIISPLADALRGKIVIDATVPLDFANLFRVATESGNSAAQETDAMLPGAQVFAAFHTISYRILRRMEHVEDVLVAGNPEGKPEVMQLIRELNLRPIDTGPLEAAGLLERMTALLISINKQNKVKDSGLKVTGI